MGLCWSHTPKLLENPCHGACFQLRSIVWMACGMLHYYMTSRLGVKWCHKIKLINHLVVYGCSGNVITSITTLGTYWQTYNVFPQKWPYFIWWIDINVRALVLLNLLYSLRKRDQMPGKPRIFLFSPTCLIHSIKHEHSCKILYILSFLSFSNC